ncbi:hypothetical protein E1N52_18005 [Paraburkholderia guartelaensis]|jgi:hypothetical protein|uniref:Uncharacterized protein n=1 Tax=Paraburkholderia guartelaensis TaxID=2546446 RepID=A0A4R5LD41_9BURK|nr:hypothetical protein [Paraburkholderia guartelaensis]TDG07138.1 hypothetical protein E1N52_18005 [Paraburkholderia guartelaensis]
MLDLASEQVAVQCHCLHDVAHDEKQMLSCHVGGALIPLTLDAHRQCRQPRSSFREVKVCGEKLKLLG